ncbi:protein BRICK1 [Ditylenchus destructor]|uniref:Protein BRICK1 n=1 Tax=Ditylenchus destructor TaxID=166010 RepID=A0AAD4R9D7_9BILA|nr:protein BRICK1 [Ditylenchus destructor]
MSEAQSNQRSPIPLPLKNNTHELIRRRFTQLTADLWNLTRRWEELEAETYTLLQQIVNTRTQLKGCLKDSNSKFMFAAEEIIRDVDRLCSSLMPTYTTILDKFAKAAETIPALRDCCHNEMPECSSLRTKADKLSETIPQLLLLYRRELEFKQDAIHELACWSDDNDKSAEPLFSAILSSWQNSIYHRFCELKNILNRNSKMSSSSSLMSQAPVPIQRQLREDWDNREFIQLISDNVKHIADFLSHFELACKSKLAALLDKITALERKVEFLEARITRGETLN